MFYCKPLYLCKTIYKMIKFFTFLFLTLVTLPSLAQPDRKSYQDLQRENFMLRVKVDSLRRILRGHDEGFATLSSPDDDFSLADNWGDLSGVDSVVTRPFSEIDTILFVPVDEKITKYLNIYTILKRKNMLSILDRYDGYRAYLSSVFKKYRIPEEFTALCIVESAVNPKACSKAGALGMWQLMEGTARDYGLTVNSLQDDRLDVAKSTVAAAKYLAAAKRKLGSWALALMSYNCGEGRMLSAIDACGEDATLEELWEQLPRETQEYLPALIAAIYVHENRHLLY